MRLRFTAKAEQQLVSIASHIGQDNKEAALRVLRKIKRAASLLADFPESGRMGAAATTREWVVHGLPYIVVYRFDREADELAVIEVVHGARRR